MEPSDPCGNHALQINPGARQAQILPKAQFPLILNDGDDGDDGDQYDRYGMAKMLTMHAIRSLVPNGAFALVKAGVIAGPS